ncbi:hypothetical protein E2562_012253 [Oryza meyeriana var. granulata]|uniref:Uncharacterized protein n=1 Tax=Oryza meyeriana var. granulata TaxID=110450 RepID=A0A6G1D2L8_9ORYZ|nr:hypothetical protein E2562_012253 [Oryza meyeriana var. granulata]
MPQVDLTDAEISEEVLGEESSEEADIDEESSEEDTLDEDSTDEATEEDASSEETDRESDPSEVATDYDEEEVDMPVTMATENDTKEEINLDDEEDDFSSDLPPEFDSAGNFSDAETESNTTLVTSSAAKAAAVKPLDDSSITGASIEVSQQEVEATLNTIVKSLDEFTFKVEGNQQDELTEEMKSTDDAGAMGAKKLKKKKKLTVDELNAKSMRKLKSMYKDGLIAKVVRGTCAFAARGGVLES